MARTVAGTFVDHEHAVKAVGALRGAGFEMSQIGLVARDNGAHVQRESITGGVDSPADEAHTIVRAAEGSLIGGTAAGLAAAAASLLIPGIGPLIAGGVLAASVLGGTGGWLIGGLAGLGITADHAEHLQRQVESGRTLVTVTAGSDTQAEQARGLLASAGAEDVSGDASSGIPAANAPMTPPMGAGTTMAPAMDTTTATTAMTAAPVEATTPTEQRQATSERIVFTPRKPAQQSGQGTILHVDEPGTAR